MSTIRRAPLRAWTALLLLAMVCASAQGAQRVALVVGNASYAHAPALANPLNDAADVGDAFERLGFSVTRLENVDDAQMRQGFKAFRRAAAASEVAVVFYAGHGIEVDGRNFLVPVDAVLASDQDVEYETVPLALVQRAVERASGLRLVILDACRDNPFAAQMQRRGATRSIGRGLARVEPPEETLVAYAAKEGTVAADGAGRNSPFSEALLAYLEEPGLEVNLLFRKVRDAVVAATGGGQVPFTYGSLSSREVYLAAAPAAAPAPAQPPAGSTADASGSARVAAERLAAERAFWNSVKDSEHPADIQAYLDLYPGGTFEALARNRLERLAVPAQVPGAPAPGTSSVATLLEEARLAAEAEFWSLVKESPDPSDLEAFLEHYPDGVYAPLARVRLSQLRRASAVAQAPAGPTAAPAPEDPPDAPASAVVQTAGPAPASVELSLGLARSERRRIQQALGALGYAPGPTDGLFGRRTRDAIRDYQTAQGHEETGYLTGGQAKSLLASGEDSRRREDDAAYARAEAEGTPEAFEAYLRAFPQGRHAAEARAREAALRAPMERAEEEARRRRAEQEAEARRAAERRADDDAYARAKAEGSLEAFEAYLRAFPGGRHVEEAQAREAALRARMERAEEEARRRRAEQEAEARRAAERRADDDAYARAKAEGSLEAFEAYLRAFPEGRHAAAIREQEVALRAQWKELGGTQPGSDAPAPAESVAQRQPDDAAGSAHLVRAPGAPGSVFRDCAECPEMVVVPAGTFRLRGPSGRVLRYHTTANIRKPPAVGVHEVTFAEWDACRQAGGCSRDPDDEAWGRGTRPVINVSWNDAKQYARWLSRKTAQTYRLLSESEWEHAARGGASTHYHWGNSVERDVANCADCGGQWGGRKTSPAGSYRANAFGLHDVQGNVGEWVLDCWTEAWGTKNAGPALGIKDGRPVLSGTAGRCDHRVVRGGSWRSDARELRFGVRGAIALDERRSDVGFRVARELN